MAQRIIDRSYIGEVLQHVYSGDLNITISLVFNGGYFYLEMNEERISLQGTTIEEAVTHLASILTQKLPASKFSIWWADNFRDESRQ